MMKPSISYKKRPAGLFQFEIGVQTTNPEALAFVERRMDFGRLSKQVVN